jgi:hypothetical protein
MNSEFQIYTYNNASSNSFDSSKINGLWKYYIFYCPKSKFWPFRFIQK